MVYANITNITSMDSLMGYVVQQEPIFGSIILIMTGCVLFFAMKERFTTSRAFAGSVFVLLLIAGIMRALDYIGNFPLAVVIALFILSIIYIAYDQ